MIYVLWSQGFAAAAQIPHVLEGPLAESKQLLYYGPDKTK